MKKAIIIANGKIPLKKNVQYLLSNGYTTLICADGGANSAKKLNLIPNFIIGDLDSIKPEVEKYFRDKTKIIKFERQNDTDVEKSLKFLIKKKFDEVILLGATGSRLDHTFCNLGIPIKYFDKILVKILHEESLLIPYKGNFSLETEPGETISLYGIDEKTKITSVGLKYPLKNFTIPFGKKDGTSNVAIGKKITIKASSGKIFIIRNFDIMRKNGFIFKS